MATCGEEGKKQSGRIWSGQEVQKRDRQPKQSEEADYSSSTNNEGNWQSSKKRKDEEEEAEDRDDTSALKKQRVVWSVELHQQFVAAVNQLGIDNGWPLLASEGSSGVISIWNLEKRRLQTVIREAHDSAIISLHLFANEPVLMSSSADNSIKMWIFDTTDGDPRLLHFRNGHSVPLFA